MLCSLMQCLKLLHRALHKVMQSPLALLDSTLCVATDHSQLYLQHLASLATLLAQLHERLREDSRLLHVGADSHFTEGSSVRSRLPVLFPGGFQLGLWVSLTVLAFAGAFF